jgi:hypothetical protein
MKMKIKIKMKIKNEIFNEIFKEIAKYIQINFINNISSNNISKIIYS